jgi:protein phosphatase
MIAAGSLTPEQARVHPQRNMITQALGCPTPIIPVLGKVVLRRRDRLLICSDGLHGEVDDARLQAIMAQAFSPRRTLEMMLEEALRNGGRDNITALLLALDDPALLLPGSGETPKVVDPDAADPDAKGSLMGRLGRMLGSR